MTFLKKHWSVFLAMTVFFVAGIYQIAQFETTDEHFWKYDRVPAYFIGLKKGMTTGDWSETRINDKPGVTVAAISGLGLPFVDHPDAHRDRERDALFLSPEQKKDGSLKPLHTFYHTDQTPEINTALRIPVLLFNLLALPVMYWLLLQSFHRRVAGITIILIGTNPILIGISRIINPDAFLWSTVTATILAYLAYLSTQRKTFLILSGLFFGGALLSKYTANILFLILPLLWALFTSHQKNVPASHKDLQTYMKDFLVMTGIACGTFLIFLPAALENIRHFLYGTVYSPTLRPLVDGVITITKTEHLFREGSSYSTIPTALLATLVVLLLIFGIAKILRTFISLQPKIVSLGFRALSTFLFLLLLLSLVNAWLDQPFFGLEHIKEVSREKGSVSFPQFSADHTIIFWLKVLAVQSQNFFFSLHPLAFLGLFTSLIMSIKERSQKYNWLLWTFTTTFFIFILGGTFANVFVNVRYSIILYPLAALLTALVLEAHLPQLKKCLPRTFTPCGNVIIVFAALGLLISSLWFIKPFYFSYTNILLPQKHYVGDAWGLGLYEASEYLNNLPDAENTVVWVDHNGLRQWFTGRTITTPYIYLDHTKIDYIVQTRRGSVLKKPAAHTDNPAKKNITFSQYYTGNKKPIWELQIGNRPGNFVRIFAVE